MKQAAPFVLLTLLLSPLASGRAEASPYKGVVPGRGKLPAHVHTGAGTHLCTWPGFQPTAGGGSRFFLLLNRPVQVAARRQGDRFVVDLPGVRVSHRNNLRALETRFFPTPVVRARVRRWGRKGLRFVLELKPGAPDPVVRTEAGPNGASYLFVEFPAAG